MGDLARAYCRDRRACDDADTRTIVRPAALLTLLVAAHVPLSAGHPLCACSMETRSQYRRLLHSSLHRRPRHRALSPCPTNASSRFDTVPLGGRELRADI